MTLADVSAELVLNWDQTGIRRIPSSSWTMARRGSKHVETVGAKGKETDNCSTLWNHVGRFPTSTNQLSNFSRIALSSGMLNR